jgi:FkbM family methyltransferase
VVKNLLNWASFPLVYVLNRALFYPFSKRLFDVALWGMGIATAYPGRFGVSYAEERFIRRIGRLIDQAVVLDVGANIGHYASTVRAHYANARVYAFEPHPTIFPKLAARGNKEGFEAVQSALSDKEGEARLHDFADVKASTQASLSHDAVKFFGRGSREFSVKCSTVDNFLQERGISHVGLLKIDTEGFDINVIRGAARALKEKRIDVIQFELIPASVICRVFLKDFFDVLDGYSIHRLCVNGSLIRLHPYETKYCEIFSMSVLVALRDGVSFGA